MRLQRNEIIEMAIRANATDIGQGTAFHFYRKELEAFAKLVDSKATAKEREACIQIVENEAYQYSAPVWAFEIVNAIKERGEQHES